MSNAQNLGYAVVQVVHNFGAVAAVGGSVAAVIIKTAAARKRLAWTALAGWGAQAASGAAFGLISFLYYQKFPDIEGIAVVALVIKMTCVALAFLLVAAYLFWGGSWTEGRKNITFYSSSALAVIALSAAAFLRWFS